ncbi:MAG: hemolysin family protein [Eubacteriales bacterium]|nr:hemolysin family protein [Eubacteriales bacterium]
MSEGDPLIGQLLFQVGLILLNAVFACAEIAVISMNDTKIQRLSDAGNRRAVKLARLTSQPARFLSTIQVGITLAGFLGSAFAADNFSDRLVNWMVGLGSTVSTSTLNGLSVILITLILSYFTLVFGELVPKRVAMKKSESLALGLSGLIYFLSKLFAPVVGLLTASTNGILRMMGIDPHANVEAITEEEIRMMLDTGSENGTIDIQESVMIQNVFEFNDKAAEDVMTHRTEVTVLWMDESLEQWEQTIRESRHARYPVCLEDRDDILGVLNIKDYYPLKEQGFDAIKAQAVQPGFFVPESIKTDVLFRNMQKERTHFAIVLDEYGGMSGIVTMSDLLEEIVGEIDDGDGEQQPPDVQSIDGQTWRVRGIVPLGDMAQVLGITLPVDEYDTFGGFIFGMLNSIPQDGAQPSFEAYGLSVKVEEIREHRVEWAVVCKADAVEVAERTL